MAISGDKYPFSEENVSRSPDVPGVYVLYDGDRTIYIGMSDSSIRSRLQDHKSGAEGQGTASASHYRRKPCDDPVARERQLLQEFKRRYGRLPPYNERMP
jgi:hypothetical protein